MRGGGRNKYTFEEEDRLETEAYLNPGGVDNGFNSARGQQQRQQMIYKQLQMVKQDRQNSIEQHLQNHLEASQRRKTLNRNEKLQGTQIN